MDFRLEDIDDAEVERRLSIVEPLTDAVRELVDAVIRTEVDDAELVDAREQIEAIVARLRAQQKDKGYGVAFTRDFTGMPWGNAATGARNAVAPPLRIKKVDGVTRADVVLGAAYEGPGGHVHGGVAALLLDQLVGETAAADHMPSFTGTLTVRYLRPTPLGPVTLEGQVTGTDGRKTFVHGELSDADGVTVEAEAIMIAPKNFPARDAIISTISKLESDSA
ncbi:PaaI family thioesterase [Gordonia sp. PDNC005]|uniref:hotdog domain-containing protein n=1 Tax=Gordonia sp. PDNC005 TaxID=2811424 RepID=UPI001965C2A0|nr:hotdog domain-containing protein [Gordonia sp. PDNC005]QRY61668.1 PaaI family thioesterase [Gordonia sp. PDNC005]